MEQPSSRPLKKRLRCSYVNLKFATIFPMKTSTYIATLLGALIVGGGIAALMLFSGSAQTQVIGPAEPCVITVTDQDGDCVDGSTDYYPYEADDLPSQPN